MMLRRVARKSPHKKEDRCLATAFPLEVQSEITWKDAETLTNSSSYENAFEACTMETGEIAYVAKCIVENQRVTGYTTKNASHAYIPYGCAEHTKSNYEVLFIKDPETLFWKGAQEGDVPKRAVIGGVDGGETQYIARTCTSLQQGRTFDGHGFILQRLATDGTRLGKLHPSHHCLYVPYNGREYIFSRYEVLCHKSSPGSLSAICKWKILNALSKNKQKKPAIDKLTLPISLKEYLKLEDDTSSPASPPKNRNDWPRYTYGGSWRY